MANNKNNNYFSQMKSQRGDDWLSTLSNENILGATKRIVRDMIRGSIQYEKDGAVFLDPRFMENFLIGIREQLKINKMNYTGCSFYYQYNPSVPDMGGHLTVLWCNVKIYEVILERLEYVKASRDISCLIDIPGILYQEKNYFIY